VIEDTVDNSKSNVVKNSINNNNIEISDEKDEYEDVNEDEDRSFIQKRGKSGFCYIGTENGIRNCINVGVNEQCMSGDIFPTMAVCVNPNLRE